MEYKIYLLSEGDAGWDTTDRFTKIKPYSEAYQKKFSDNAIYWCVNIENISELLNIKNESCCDIVLEQDCDEIRLILIDSDMSYIQSTSRYFSEESFEQKEFEKLRYQSHQNNKACIGEELNTYYVK